MPFFPIHISLHHTRTRLWMNTSRWWSELTSLALEFFSAKCSVVVLHFDFPFNEEKKLLFWGKVKNCSYFSWPHSNDNHKSHLENESLARPSLNLLCKFQRSARGIGVGFLSRISVLAAFVLWTLQSCCGFRLPLSLASLWYVNNVVFLVCLF